MLRRAATAHFPDGRDVVHLPRLSRDGPAARHVHTGLPTATYVFVNMLRKLREDFAPEYLAAVFDVAGPTFRDEQAEADHQRPPL